MNTRKWAAAIGVVVLGVVMTGFVPVAASATQNEQNEGISIPDEFCTADIPGKDAVSGVPAKTEYQWSKDSPGEGWVKTRHHKWVVTQEATEGHWTDGEWYIWTGGPSESAPAFDADGWKDNPQPNVPNGVPHNAEPGVYSTSNENGNGSWFKHTSEWVAGTEEVKHKEYKWKSYTPAIPGEDAVPPVPGVCDVWVTWVTPDWAPDANDASDVGWPQTFVQFGKGKPTECEVTYQIDRYQGSRDDIEDVIGDGTLTGYPPAEDAGIVTDWYFESSDECLGVATASWSGTVPTCLDLDGAGEFAFENASVTSAFRAGDDVDYAGGFTPGTHNNPFAGIWTVTLTADDGFEFEGGETVKVLHIVIEHLTAQDCLIEVTPDRPEWVDPCGEDNGHWVLPETEGVTYTTSVKKNGAIQVTATPNEGYEFPEGAKVQWTKKDSGELCPVVLPVPAQFNADPAPASCVAPGSFDDAALGGTWVGGDEEWRDYEFENFWLSVYVGVPGQVTLYLYAMDPYTFENLDESKWWVSEDGIYAERTIYLAAQLSGPEACPQDVPAPLTGEDVTEVGACEVPLDGTATVTTTTTAWSQEYVWDDETGEYILGEKVYAEPVVTVAVEDAPQCAPGDIPPPSLSETGFENMAGAYGSAALLLTGLGLLVTRRLMAR